MLLTVVSREAFSGVHPHRGRGRACPGHLDHFCSVPGKSGSPGQARRRRPRGFNMTEIRSRAFDEKIESMMGDSHNGANRIQDPHWNKGASHEWGSLIPTICANVSLRQSKPVIAV